jgi:GNAT superfamily N-acetyltransferase
MADAVIDVVGMDELPQIVDLYNQIYRPARPLESFRRRFLGRYNVLSLLARVDEKPVGFFTGYEQQPAVFHAWAYGVVPDARRLGVGSQLMEAAQGWAAQHNYESLRLECHNRQRAMLQMAVTLGYDVVGLRWDAERGDNFVIFEKLLSV